MHCLKRLSKKGSLYKVLNSKELYKTIVNHRSRFTKISGIDYNLHNPKTINPIPVNEIIDDWEKDYKTMLDHVIYVPNPPTFESVITHLKRLKSNLKSLCWQFELNF